MARLPSVPSRIEAIALGASSGGAEALAAILTNLPEGTTASLFIVLHIPRNRPSLLVDIFRARCPLPLHEAMDKLPIEPGHVYFAPPDYHLLIDEGPQLALSIDEPVCFSRPSIDVLFESAAQFYRERLLGIVLTGGNEDGAAGLRAIHAAGGMAVIQDPADARVSTMPAAAMHLVPDAAVLSLEQITHVLKTLKTEVSA